MPARSFEGLTLGELRNRLDALLQHNNFQPGMPVYYVLNLEKFNELCADSTDRERFYRKYAEPTR